jgi:hypothetical protein
MTFNSTFPRAIKASHPAIIFDPDIKIFQFAVCILPRQQHFIHMAPVHADEMDGAIGTMLGEIFERVLEESYKLRLGHLTRAHNKLSVLDCSGATNMTSDRNIVGGIGKDHLGLLPGKEKTIGLLIQRASADQAMRSQKPDIMLLGNRCN